MLTRARDHAREFPLNKISAVSAFTCLRIYREKKEEENKKCRRSDIFTAFHRQNAQFTVDFCAGRSQFSRSRSLIATLTQIALGTTIRIVGRIRLVIENALLRRELVTSAQNAHLSHLLAGKKKRVPSPWSLIIILTIPCDRCAWGLGYSRAIIVLMAHPEYPTNCASLRLQRSDR